MNRGYQIGVVDPVWLAHERLLAAPQPGAMLQPMDVNPVDQLPALPAAASREETDDAAAA